MRCLCPKDAIRHVPCMTSLQGSPSLPPCTPLCFFLYRRDPNAQSLCMSSSLHDFPEVLHIFVNYKLLFVTQQYAVNHLRSWFCAHKPGFPRWGPASLPTQLLSQGLRNHRTPQVHYWVRDGKPDSLGGVQWKEKTCSERWQWSNSFNL